MGAFVSFFLKVISLLEVIFLRILRLGRTIVGNLLDIVNQAIQDPLDIDFHFSPEGKSILVWVWMLAKTGSATAKRCG